MKVKVIDLNDSGFIVDVGRTSEVKSLRRTTRNEASSTDYAVISCVVHVHV